MITKLGSRKNDTFTEGYFSLWQSLGMLFFLSLVLDVSALNPLYLSPTVERWPFPLVVRARHYIVHIQDTLYRFPAGNVCLHMVIPL